VYASSTAGGLAAAARVVAYLIKVHIKMLLKGLNGSTGSLQMSLLLTFG
jgi:hypothetical protein